MGRHSYQQLITYYDDPELCVCLTVTSYMVSEKDVRHILFFYSENKYKLPCNFASFILLLKPAEAFTVVMYVEVPTITVFL